MGLGRSNGVEVLGVGESQSAATSEFQGVWNDEKEQLAVIAMTCYINHRGTASPPSSREVPDDASRVRHDASTCVSCVHDHDSCSEMLATSCAGCPMSLMSPVLGSSEDRIIDIMRYEDKLDDFIIGRYAAFDSTSSFHSALPLTHDSMLKTPCSVHSGQMKFTVAGEGRSVSWEPWSDEVRASRRQIPPLFRCLCI